MEEPLEGIDPDRLRERWGQKWSSVGPDVLAAWVADADGAPAQPVVSAVERLLEVGDLTYPHLEAEAQIAGLFADRVRRRHGWVIDPQDVMVGTDIVQLMSFAIDRLSSVDEPVMIHTPCYSGLHREITALGRRLWPLRWTRAGSRWTASPDDVVAGAAAGARLLVLVNPHNPTGRVWTRSELEQLAEIAVTHDLVVASDEVFADLTLDQARHTPIASLSPEVAARTVTVTSASKSHNVAGVRCAVAHLGGSPLLDPLRAVPVRQLGSVSNFGFAVTAAVWRDGDDWLDSFRAAIAARRDQAMAFIAEYLPDAVVVAPEAGFLLWVDLGALGLPEPIEEFFLERALVRILGGGDFAQGGEGFVRVNLATSAEMLDEILQRMVTAVDLWRAGR